MEELVLIKSLNGSSDNGSFIPTGQFGSNLFIVRAVLKTKAPNNTFYLPSNSQELEEDKYYFYKEIVYDASGSAARNSRINNDAIVELQMLRAAKERNFNMIVRLITQIDLGVGRGFGIILELAKASLFQMYFNSKTREILPVKNFGSQENYIAFLHHMEMFFVSILNFLQSIEMVYCDWKPENILCFHDRIDCDTLSLRFKLADFGSAQRANVPIQNPKNVNQLFGSKSFAPFIELVTPQFKDDWISVCYLFYKLNGLKLPWELNYTNMPAQPTENDLNFVFSLTAFFKTHPLFNLNPTQYAVYWPSQKYFGVFKE